MNDDTTRRRMSELAESFSCARRAWGVNPFEPEELSRWAASGVAHGE